MNKKNVYLVVVFLITVSCLAFGRIAGNDFVNYDDTGFLTKNYHVQSGFNKESVQWAFTTTHLSYWHPLTWLSLIADWTIFGTNASGHHLVSLFLHIGAVIFLFLFLFKATNNIWPSAFAAAFFALHPLRVESVAWASERKDVLSMFFGMAALWAYALYAVKKNLSTYFYCLILFTLALMSKPMMVTLPFVLMLLDYWPLNRWQTVIEAPSEKKSGLGGKLLWEKIPFFCLSAIVSIAAFGAQSEEGSVASDSILPVATRIANATVSYSAYLVKTVYPVNLSVYYPYNFSIPAWEVLSSAVFLTSVTIAVFYYMRKCPFLFAGWFWYLGTLIPVIGLIQSGTQSMADRYTYLPSIGLAVVLAWGIFYWVEKHEKYRKTVFGASVALIMIISVLTWNQCGYWKNSSSLFSHALHVTKENFIAHKHLGSYLAEKGNLSAALYHYNKSLSIKPQPVLSYAGSYIDRGNIYARLSMRDQAVADFDKAVSLKPDSAEGYQARGTAYAKFMGEYKQAIKDFDKAIQLKPDYVEAFNNRGIAWDKLGSYQKAVDDFNEAIRLRPDYADAWNNKAFSYLNLGDKEAGCSGANEACKLGNCRTLKDAKIKGLCN